MLPIHLINLMNSGVAIEIVSDNAKSQCSPVAETSRLPERRHSDSSLYRTRSKLASRWQSTAAKDDIACRDSAPVMKVRRSGSDAPVMPARS
jgi:hypothetical protein